MACGQLLGIREPCILGPDPLGRNSSPGASEPGCLTALGSSWPQAGRQFLRKPEYQAYLDWFFSPSLIFWCQPDHPTLLFLFFLHFQAQNLNTVSHPPPPTEVSERLWLVLWLCFSQLLCSALGWGWLMYAQWLTLLPPLEPTAALWSRLAKDYYIHFIDEKYEIWVLQNWERDKSKNTTPVIFLAAALFLFICLFIF